MEVLSHQRTRSRTILAERIHSDNAPLPALVLSRPTARAFWRWVRKDLKLFELLRDVQDGREQCRTRVPLRVMLVGVLAMYWFGLPSLVAVDDQLRHCHWLRRLLAPLGYGDPIADDTFRNALAKVEADDLRRALHLLGRKLLKGWGAGRYRESHIGRRLAALGMQKLASRAIVTIDGHYLFGTTSAKRCCAECLQKTEVVDGQRVTRYYHMALVAQMMGAHPALLLDFEPLLPGENELVAVKRMLPRLREAYGDRIGLIVADAMYDNEPFRRLVFGCGYRSIVVHKVDNSSFAVKARKALVERDPFRHRPDFKHHPDRQVAYRVWEQPAGGRWIVEVRRQDRRGEWKSQAITDLPRAETHPVAVGIIVEERWEVENKGFKQLVEDWNLDRAYVHTDKPQAVRAFVALALMAYNVFHQFVYSILRLDPYEPVRPLQALRRDLIHTVADLGARGPPRAAPPHRRA
jgi:hypothetical protein